MLRRISSVLLLLFTSASANLLSGCDQQAVLHKVAGADHEARARQYVDFVRTGEYGPIRRDLDPSIQTPDISNGLKAMAALFPPGEPKSVKLVGARTFRGTSEDRSSLTYEYEYPSRWILAEITTRSSDQSTTITSFHVQKLMESVESSSRFTLLNKAGPEYTMLFFAIATLSLSLFAFVTCLRQRQLPRKWLWAIFTLVGLGQFAMNWNTGGVAFRLLWLTLIPVSASANAYSPWVLSVSFPVGAITFLVWNEGRLSRTSSAPST